MSIKRITALLLAIVMPMALFSGCGKEDQYSEYVSYIEVIEEVEGDSTDSQPTSTDTTASDNANDNKTSSPASTPAQSTDNKINTDLGGRTIIYQTYWAEPEKGGSDRENAYWKKKAEIEKKYNCKFKHVSGNDDNLYDNIITSIIAGKPSCDIISSKQIAFPAMKQGLFYDLGSLKSINLNDEKWQKFVTEFGTLNGKKYLMEAGRRFNDGMIVYNKDLFTAKKQPDLFELQDKGELTLSKLVSIMENINGGKTSTLVDIFPFNMHIQFAYAYGGQIVTRTAGTTDFQNTIDSAAVTKGFKEAQQLLDKGIVVNDAKGDWQWARNEFLKGNYPIMIGSGDLENIASNCSFDLGVCQMPSENGTPLNVISDVQWAAIPYNAKNPEEIAMVFDDMADVIFDVNYKVRYQDILSKDAMKVLAKKADVQTKGQVKVDYYNVIDIWEDGVGGVFNQMIAGSVPPSTAIQSVSSMINTKLKTLK